MPEFRTVEYKGVKHELTLTDITKEVYETTKHGIAFAVSYTSDKGRFDIGGLHRFAPNWDWNGTDCPEMGTAKSKNAALEALVKAHVDYKART